MLALLAVLVLVPGTGAVAGRCSRRCSALLARHVPILVLHPAERFGPVRVDGFLADSDLQRKTASGWETIGGPLPAGGADLRLDQRLVSRDRRCRRVVVLRGGRGGSRLGAGRVREGVPHEDADRSPVLDLVPVQRLQPDSAGRRALAGARRRLGSGVGHPRLRAARRSSRATRSTARGSVVSGPGSRSVGLRPLVYVALGSHANYFARGVHRFDPRVVEPLLISIIEQARIRAGRSHGNGAHRASAPRSGDRCDAVVDDLRRQVGRGPVPPRSGQSPTQSGGGPRGPASRSTGASLSSTCSAGRAVSPTRARSSRGTPRRPSSRPERPSRR